MKCFYCEQYITNPISHVKTCAVYAERIASITKELLEELYINQKMSMQDVAGALGLKNQTVLNRLAKQWNIPKRSLSEACKNGSAKRIATHLDRYGTPHNFCKNSPSRQDWERRLREEEGIVNVFQREDVKRKSAQTMCERYGVEYIGKLCRGRKVFSLLHKDVVDFLSSHNISFWVEHKLYASTGAQYLYSYDIVIPSISGIVEVNGDYWHGNPEFYKANDLLLKGSSKEYSVREKWEKDRIKLEFAKFRGYQIMVIWESDWKNPNSTIRQDLINYANSKNQEYKEAFAGP